MENAPATTDSLLPAPAAPSTASLVLSADNMNNIVQFAEFMASGKSTLPKHLQGSPSDCMAVCLQAMQWNMLPHAVAQKTHLVNGVLGYEAQLINAVISSSTAIEGRFHYQYKGDWANNDGKSKDMQRHVLVGATLRGESEIQWGEPMFPATVTTKNSPLWKTNEKQQSAYLALKYWSRLYAPAVVMGVYTPDELREIAAEPRDITPAAKPQSALQMPADENPAIDAEYVADNEQEAKLIPTATILESIINSVTIEELDEIRVLAEQHPKDSDDFAEMVARWKTKKAEILRAIDEAELNQQE